MQIKRKEDQIAAQWVNQRLRKWNISDTLAKKMQFIFSGAVNPLQAMEILDFQGPENGSIFDMPADWGS